MHTQKLKFTTVNPTTEEIIGEYSLMSIEEVISVAKKSNITFNGKENKITIDLSKKKKLIVFL